MTSETDQRTYDTLRLLATHEPVGSVRLTDLLRERGYSITERSVRFTLADLDADGLTEKVGGKGRQLTDAGRAELERGGVRGRVEQVRERLAELIGRVTYDPAADGGDVVVGRVTVPEAERSTVEELLRSIDRSPLGPAPVSIDPVDGDDGTVLELAATSSVTIDGVLLANGIESDLETTGIVEYRPDVESAEDEDTDGVVRGGSIRRFTDVIGGERATLDMVSLLIEARRTTVERVLEGETGLVVADNREIPLSRYETVRDLAVETRDGLGGVVDLRRPRESGPFPWGQPGWSFASLTCIGTAELVISAVVEADLALEWETLAGVRRRSELTPVSSR